MTDRPLPGPESEVEPGRESFRPLQGITVLDLTRLVAGASVTHFLADLGAEVVKMEQPPYGDAIRRIPPLVGDISLYHLLLDRGKRSVAADLATAAGRAMLHDLVGRADALVTTHRPEVLARYGASSRELQDHNPRLVHLSLTAFGATSPHSAQPMHGSNITSLAGVQGVAELDDGTPVAAPLPPRRQRVPMDQIGLHAALVLLAAVVEARATGRGRRLDVSMAHLLMRADAVGMAEQVNGLHDQAHESGVSARYGFFRAADGRILCACLAERRFWERFCDAIGRPELKERSPDEAAFGGEDRRLHADVQATLAARPSSEWLPILADARVPVTRVNTVAEAVADPDVGSSLWTIVHFPPPAEPQWAPTGVGETPSGGSAPNDAQQPVAQPGQDAAGRTVWLPGPLPVQPGPAAPSPLPPAYGADTERLAPARGRPTEGARP